MPEALERRLRVQVNRLHPNWSKERKDAYVYGTLRKTGWKPSNPKKKKSNWDKYRKAKQKRKK